MRAALYVRVSTRKQTISRPRPKLAGSGRHVDYRDKQRGDDQGHSGSTHDPLAGKIADDEGCEPGDTDHYCGECSDGSESHPWIFAQGLE